MKNKIAKAGLCVIAAGLLFTGTVYGAEALQEYDDIPVVSTSQAFWRKKDKETAPGTETPDASPSPSPSATPTGAPKDAPKMNTPKATPQAETTPKATPNEAPQPSPQASPVAAPKETPKATPEASPNTNQPKETSDIDNDGFDYEATLARYYQQGDSQHRNQSQPQGGQQRRHPNSSNNAVSEEIHRILASQPNIQLEPNAYIVQHEDGLWLVMGNIRAKLDILIYVDHKNMKDAEIFNAIPLYK